MLLPLVLSLALHPCEPCHAGIVKSYAQTAMARTSGKVNPAEHASAKPFTEPRSQATYEVTSALELRFAKPGFEGARLLEFFIGSGRVGRSYLFQTDQHWFQSPLSYFTEAQRWQLSPGFGRRPAIELTRAIEPSCFQCHTTSMAGGIGCERCHGDATKHAASGGKQPVVHPGKLGAQERDSICAQCHLTGTARVARYRPQGDTYQPGRKLSDYSAIFIGAEATSEGIGVTSHFEKMAASACARSAGLTCTTCHDPHSEPANASTFFNAKCQGCHQQKPCPQAPQGDCIQCHMPKANGRGVDHSSYTDHSIPRRGVRNTAVKDLTPFWPGTTNDRDLALALAVRGNLTEAKPLLEAATKKEPKDVAALSQLAQIAEREGREDPSLYEAILKLDAKHAVAAANLGVLRVKTGQVDEAIRLWRIALAANPAQTGIRMNIAQAYFRTNRRKEATTELEQVLRYDPDQPAARRMLNQLSGAPR